MGALPDPEYLISRGLVSRFLHWEYQSLVTCAISHEGEKVSDNVSRGQQAADEVARRWITAMQSMADQIQRQQQTFQQMIQDSMNTYMQLLNTPPFSPFEQSQEG